MGYDPIRRKTIIIKVLLLLNVISQCHHYVSGTTINYSITLQYPFFFADVIRTYLTSVLKDTFKQMTMNIQELQGCK